LPGGPKLERALAVRGLTQTWLAARLRVRPPTVSRWCCGVAAPKPHQQAVLRDLFGIDAMSWIPSPARRRIARAAELVRRNLQRLEEIA
jgi:ribosome-binding protein aMBF1 (putative translation factor)